MSEKKENYALLMGKNIQETPKATRLLLHTCCAPCLCGVLPQLSEHFALSIYYYNPCIAPHAEYEKRLIALKQLLDVMPEAAGAKIICGQYNEDEFVKLTSGLEKEPEGGKRCETCIALRLNETARKAAEEGIEWFCTTLTVSPHKNAKMINELGMAAAKQYGVKFLQSDFKKNEGYKNSIMLSKKYEIYRQNYCGCTFSADRMQK